jgi:hypothetical protein
MKKFTTCLFLLLLTSCGLLNSKDETPDIPGKIVFSAKDEAGTNQIYTMKANGTEVRQLTDWEQTSSIMPS